MEEGYATVYVERLGRIGVIQRDFRFSVVEGAFKFRYVGDTWMQLKYDENTAVLEAVKEPIVLMNVTHRLTS